MKKFKKAGIGGLLIVIMAVTFAFRTDYFEVAKQIEIYTTLFKELNLYYIDETNPAALTDSAIKNMLKDLDPYTQFYDEQGVEEVKILSAGEYSGIGATTKYVNGKLTIVELHKDMPAEKAGIKVGDEIIKVNTVPVSSKNMNDIAALLKGAEETTVDLQMLRQQKKISFKVERKKIDINPVPHYQMIGDDIGYISFIKFNNRGSEAIKSAYLELKDQGMKKLILDLRGNPGGLLNEAINITNFFIPKGEVVVTTKAKLKKWSETYRTKNQPLDLEIPVVVLINGHSASASEIVAGSLQDLDRAVILGERSFGKGLVQRYRDLPYGTKLKITISKYYTPSGRNIQELDYANRTKQNIPKYSDKPRNAYKTRNGRTVYDGGGIQPDIVIDKPKKTKATEALLKSDAIFTFVTDYYYKHKEIAPAKDFKISDKDYQDFLNYLHQNSNSFTTKTERVFEEGLKMAEEEHLKSGIDKEFSALMQNISDQKIDDLEINKNEILNSLNDEILNRYYFKKGEYINHISHSRFIQEAVNVLNDEEKYKKILQ